MIGKTVLYQERNWDIYALFFHGKYQNNIPTAIFRLHIYESVVIFSTRFIMYLITKKNLLKILKMYLIYFIGIAYLYF